MMTKMQFACKVMKMREKIENVDMMLRSDEYNLLSAFTETRTRKDLMEDFIDGQANVLMYNLQDNMIKEVKDELIKILSMSCDWFNIQVTIKKLEKLGVEFKED